MKRAEYLRVLTGLLVLASFLTGWGIYVPMAEGVPAMPGGRTHKQSNGYIVSGEVHDDEFLNYMADATGCLLAFGDDGDLYCANWISEGDLPAGSPSPRCRDFLFFKGELILKYAEIA